MAKKPDLLIGERYNWDNHILPLLNQEILPAAVLHIKACGTFWIEKKANVETNKKFNHLMNVAAELTNACAENYIMLSDALVLPASTVIPKHIIATGIELKNQNYQDFNKMINLFERFPEHECVVDFGIAERVEKSFFGSWGPGNITKISIVGKNLTSIDNHFLFHHIRLTSVTIPHSVIHIGDFYLSKCTSIVSGMIPSNVISIGMFLFSNCNNLTTVIIPDSVTSIGLFPFDNCPILTSVTMPKRFQGSKPLYSLSKKVHVTFCDVVGS